MSIALRPAGPADAATLATIGARTFTETFGRLYDPADLAAFLAVHSADCWADVLADPAHPVLLAEDEGGEAVGYARLGPPSLPFTPREPTAIELRQFYTLAGQHGTGLAARMFDWALGRARASGAAALYLSVFVDNHRARRFYERRGFVRVGAYAFMVGNHADEDDVMRLDL